MKIVTLYSPSHKGMLDKYFLPSFPKNPNLELKIIEAEQIAGDTPTFNDSKWKEFMKIKARVLYDELVSIPEGDVYGFLDVDIINVNDFHDYIVDAIKDVDFIAQSDSPIRELVNICTGIIFFKNNENCRNLLKAVNAYLSQFNNEQEALTYFTATHTKFEELRTLKAGIMPFTRAFTYGSFNKKTWYGQDLGFSLPPKDKLLWVHANYAQHEYKELLLQLFNEKLSQM